MSTKEVLYGINMTMMLNGSFAGFHDENNRLEGMEQLSPIDYREDLPEQLVWDVVDGDQKHDFATLPEGHPRRKWDVPPDATSVWRTASLEEAISGTSAPDGPVGGVVDGVEFQRLRAAITTDYWNGQCPGGSYGPAAAHERRQKHAVDTASFQNDFAAVGAGAKRFVLHFS